MSILYICSNKYPDYQCDLIFIGLRNILGDSVVDLHKIEYLYKDYALPRNKLYGKGFTYTNTLDSINIDRDDIISKIKSKFFKKIIYGSIHRNCEYLDIVQEIYDYKDIIYIDGEDNSSQYIKSVLNKGIYFKREYASTIPNILPIQFCIPKDKMATSFTKTKYIASLIPGNTSTYTFNTEQDYYNEYKNSTFAITTKKAGWDCLRHYEILGNGCIPVFNPLDNKEENLLKNCPINTMHLFPKSIVNQMTHIYNCNYNMDKNDFILNMCNILLNYTNEFLTCESYCKKYFLNAIGYNHE